MKRIFFILLSVLVFSCAEDPKPVKKKVNKPKPIPQISYSVVKEYPHDSTSFTQGLLVHEGVMYESTGSPSNIPFTRSHFGILDLETGKIDVKAELDKNLYFGEGISILNDKIYQLTYTSQKCFVYNKNSFKQIKEITYSNSEGWGLTNDGKNLIMSDGSYFLFFLDPETFSVVKRIPVTRNKVTVNYLNELEYINGYIYANIWLDTKIVKIDPKTGYIVGEFDIKDLYKKSIERYQYSQETNGIAYDSISEKMYVTGKMWPLLFEIKLEN